MDRVIATVNSANPQRYRLSSRDSVPAKSNGSQAMDVRWGSTCTSRCTRKHVCEREEIREGRLETSIRPRGTRSSRTARTARECRASSTGRCRSGVEKSGAGDKERRSENWQAAVLAKLVRVPKRPFAPDERVIGEFVPAAHLDRYLKSQRILRRRSSGLWCDQGA